MLHLLQEKETALAWATTEGRVEVISFLRADVNIIDKVTSFGPLLCQTVVVVLMAVVVL
jgi:ankyrin repeat protein